MKNLSITSYDNLKLSVAVFEHKNPKALVQIIHGAKEHKERYYDFAKFLNDNGYAVILSDNRGHGGSVNNTFKLGHMEDPDLLVDDQYKITKYIKHKYPKKPLYIFSHSFGSCIARLYIQTHDDEIEKLVMTGTVKRFPAISMCKPILKTVYTFDGKYGHFPPFVKLFDNDNDSWVVFNKKAKEKRAKDFLCVGYKYTNSSYKVICDVVNKIYNLYDYQVKNSDLKILSITGGFDPFTGGNKGLNHTVDFMKKTGYKYVKSIVYPYMKHEVINETASILIYYDVLEFFKT